jgi:asparagine synthase (glutamine-hydrolysing)
MCGFTGFYFALPTTDAAIGLVADQAEQLFHRGPDAGGAWINPDLAVGLGHRRLAIQDLTEAGAQPMHSRCGRYVIVFNGEIYNHLDLRRSDIFSDAERASFKGHSDTETLVELIAKLGLKAKALDTSFWPATFGGCFLVIIMAPLGLAWWMCDKARM